MIFNVCAGAPRYPIGTLSLNGTSYSFDLNSASSFPGGDVIDYDGAKIIRIKQSMTIQFNSIMPKNNVLQLVGAGGQGQYELQYSSYSGDRWVNAWGGNGGGVYTVNNFVPTLGTSYYLQVGAFNNGGATAGNSTGFGYNSNTNGMNGNTVCIDGVRRGVQGGSNSNVVGSSSSSWTHTYNGNGGTAVAGGVGYNYDVGYWATGTAYYGDDGIILIKVGVL